MKSVTFVKLTREESIVLARAEEILSELEDQFPDGDDLIEIVGNALAYLTIAMEKLEGMGNDFRIPLEWPELVEREGKPQPKKDLDYSWKGTVPESY